MTNEQRVIFLRGQIVNLRPLAKADVPQLTLWINDPDIRQFIVNIFPQTEKNEEDWFNRLGSDESNIILGIETLDGTLIGTMGLHRIDWINRTATTGALIGNKEYWGRGFGTDAKMALLEYAFNTLNLRKICSEAYAFNKRSVHYSLHCGYKIEGKKRKQVFKNGKYWDVIQLGLFKEEWEPIWKRYNKNGKIR
jgi:RimJ/RimL family protein N-acetyltransferase